MTQARKSKQDKTQTAKFPECLCFAFENFSLFLKTQYFQNHEINIRNTRKIEDSKTSIRLEKRATTHIRKTLSQLCAILLLGLAHVAKHIYRVFQK
jgi:hypothetical protein